MSKSEWARQAGIGQTTFWHWARGSGSGAGIGAATAGVEFVRLDRVRAAMGLAEADVGTAALQGEMTLENGELRVVARRGTRWSDVERMVELLRSAK